MTRAKVAIHHHLVDAIEHAVALVDDQTLAFSWVNATMAGWTGLGTGDLVTSLAGNVRDEKLRTRMLRRAPIRFEGLYLVQQQHRAVSWSLRQLPGHSAWLLEGRDDTRLRRERAIAQAYVDERLRGHTGDSSDDPHVYALDVIDGLLQTRSQELHRNGQMPLAVAMRWADAHNVARLCEGLQASGVEPILCGQRTLVGVMGVPVADQASANGALDALATQLESGPLLAMGVSAAVNLRPPATDGSGTWPADTTTALLELLAVSRLGDLVLSARLARYCGCTATVQLLPHGAVPWAGGCRPFAPRRRLSDG